VIAPLLLVAVERRAHAFVLVAPEGTKRVAVAGTFNGWNATANPMRVGDDGRTYRLTLDLPYGVYQYKFVVDGDRWIVDPKGKTIDDGNGNQNSELLIVPADFDRPARRGDDRIARSGVLHEQSSGWLNVDRGRLTVRLRTRKDDLQRVEFAVAGATSCVEMARESSDALYETWVANRAYDPAKPFRYSFRLWDGGAPVGYGAKGYGTTTPFLASSRTIRPFVVPAWAQDAVQYQIFPDRFANGSKANDPARVEDWATGKPTYSNRFGGDAAGIRERIPYLAGLGVTSLYLNPVFASPSNHRYEADDFRRVDPEIGTNAEFGALTVALRGAGIRTVVDWSLNHSSPEFFAFRDLREKGAASAYRSWYFPKSLPIVYPVPAGQKPNYEAWFDYPSMPKFQVMNPATRDYLLGLLAFWKKEAPGIGGIRLDVANEVDPRFWRLFRKEAKRLDPTLWIAGENWGDSRPWLQGDQWDAAMNYPFRAAVLGFVAEGKTTARQFGDDLMKVYGWYPPQVSRGMMNLLGSHDTPRFRTLCGGDERLARLGATVEFTWVGVPSIYYGDELGMEGGVDPDNRRPMRWDLATDANPTLRHYRRLIEIRRASRALRQGDPVILKTDDAARVVAYGRILGGSTALVAINRSDRPRNVRLDLPPAFAGRSYVDALGGAPVQAQGRTLTISLSPLSAAVLLPKGEVSRPSALAAPSSFPSEEKQ
jgi:cyclomaltodextrinase / maltogenic alpha-amylase / neopullulanase